MEQVRLRAAEPHEADDITALARRSKAYCGYDQEFLDRVRDLLTVRPEQIRGDRVVVAERDGTLLGYYQLAGEPPDGDSTERGGLYTSGRASADRYPPPTDLVEIVSMWQLVPIRTQRHRTRSRSRRDRNR
jgi:hypothetical protein